MHLEGWIEWHVASRLAPNQAVSGDAWIAIPTLSGLLVAVVDGLGHGPEAAEAATRACQTLRNSPDEAPDILIRRCHAALRGTRGAALTIANINKGGGLRWLGVGNVEAVVARAQGAPPPGRDTLMLLPGVVGYQIPALRLLETEFQAGDVLVIATDGVRADFIETLAARDGPARTAQQVLDAYCTGHDDALVLTVARMGDAP